MLPICTISMCIVVINKEKSMTTQNTLRGMYILITDPHGVDQLFIATLHPRSKVLLKVEPQ